MIEKSEYFVRKAKAKNKNLAKLIQKSMKTSFFCKLSLQFVFFLFRVVSGFPFRLVMFILYFYDNGAPTATARHFNSFLAKRTDSYSNVGKIVFQQL
jgi:hypothetical protein